MKNLFKSLNKRPIAYYPAYAEITGSVKAGILLSQIMYWHEAMKEQPFYKAESDWLEELAMNRKEFKNARATLEVLGLITVEVQGNKRQTFYYPEVDIIIEKIVSIVPKRDNGKCRKGTMQSTETAQCTYTENTTETTTERGAKIAPRSETFQEWFDREIPKVESELYHEQKKFIAYWTEKSPGGKKFAWEIAKARKGTFDIVLRWNTWTKKFREHLAAEERKRTEYFIKKKELEGGRRSSGGMMAIGELIKTRTPQ